MKRHGKQTERGIAMSTKRGGIAKGNKDEGRKQRGETSEINRERHKGSRRGRTGGSN
jgi:hypothetical protein